MPKRNRLHGADIRRLTPEKRLSSALFSLSISKTQGDGQVACTVSKKVSPKAVVRNLVKRRMRAGLRAALPLPTGKSFELIAKKAAAESEYRAICDDIRELMARVA